MQRIATQSSNSELHILTNEEQHVKSQSSKSTEKDSYMSRTQFPSIPSTQIEAAKTAVFRNVTSLRQNRRRYPHIQSEIEALQQAKEKQLNMPVEKEWKATLKQQLEDDIERRVREVLKTPPLERMMRARENAKRRSQMEERDKLNAHVQFDLTERERLWLREKRLRMIQGTFGDPDNLRRRESIEGNTSSENSDDYGDRLLRLERNRFQYYLRRPSKGLSDTEVAHNSMESEGRLHAMSHGVSTNEKVVRFSDTVDTKTHFRTGTEAMEQFGSLTRREKEVLFSNFTHDGFKEAMRTGCLPDGTRLEFLGNDQYRDRYGIIRDRHGPFWPRDKGPMHAKPIHKRLPPPELEPLINPTDLSKEPQQTYENQETSYNGRWRGVQIVYDADKSARTYTMPVTPENVCPSLAFESRFESGNLQQARRIGQFEYELVLQTDLYTKRHTQWFYFRVSNMVPGITYKFLIVNLLKRASLYMDGMRPLFYSEMNVQRNGVGWYRKGHHIRYSRNVTHLQCPIMQRDMVYYQMEWQAEFDHSEDTCYFAHCYPYTYTDLKDDIRSLLSDPRRSRVTEKNVLCDTRAGNSCFLLTITDPDVPIEEKKGVVVSARVHPGETNSSWMMKGLLEHLTGQDTNAVELRRRFVFKIVPMLNPDGVIVGNYRCSLAARDLNRNYRHPRSESFPTIWHTKAMVEELSKSCDVVLYCDMHGHSRRHNVFMYGCDSHYRNVENVNSYTPKLPKKKAEAYLEERLFPWLMAQKAPEMFSFNGCRFHIRKGKESTGRVVVWRQLCIENSFTMEATFSGTTISKSSARHFNTNDLQDMGQFFGEALHAYEGVTKNTDERMATIIDMAKTVIQQLIESRGLMRTRVPNEKTLVKRLFTDGEESGESTMDTNDATKVDEGRKMEDDLEGRQGADDEESRRLSHLLDNFSLESMENTIELLETMNQGPMEEDMSESSDSDSESNPEAPPPLYTKEKKKKKKKSKRQRDAETKRNPNDDLDKKELSKSTGNLPTISGNDTFRRNRRQSLGNEKREESSTSERRSSKTRTYPLFVSKFEGRSNGGIPCFSEERVLERATKRLDTLQSAEAERKKQAALYMLSEDNSTAIDEIRQRLNHIIHSGRLEQESLQAFRDDHSQLAGFTEDEWRELYPVLNDLANAEGSSSGEEVDESIAKPIPIQIKLNPIRSHAPGTVDLNGAISKYQKRLFPYHPDSTSRRRSSSIFVAPSKGGGVPQAVRALGDGCIPHGHLAYSSSASALQDVQHVSATPFVHSTSMNNLNNGYLHRTLQTDAKSKKSKKETSIHDLRLP